MGLLISWPYGQYGEILQKLNKPQLGDGFFLVDSLIMGIFRVLIKIVFVSKKNVLEKIRKLAGMIFLPKLLVHTC